MDERWPLRIRKGKWDGEILTAELYEDPYRIPKDAKVVIDIGAHIGGTSVYAASLGAHVYAYEPSKENYRLLQTNSLAVRVPGRIDTFNLGIGYPPGKRKLYLSNVNYGGFGLYKQDPDGVEEIEVITLEQALEGIETVDVLKSDCEGAEYEFFGHCDEKLFDRIKQISLELHYCTPEHVNPFLVETFGANYVADLKEKLARHYKIETRNSGAKSAQFLICTK